jgi:hypothetical protein
MPSQIRSLRGFLNHVKTLVRIRCPARFAGLLLAVWVALACAPTAWAAPVVVTGYDIEATAGSGFGGHVHSYAPAPTDTGRRVTGSAACDFPQTQCVVVDEIGGGGTLNDGNSDVTQLFTNRNDTTGTPINPIITLHLGRAVEVQRVTLDGGNGGIFSGVVNAATVMIGDLRVPLRPSVAGRLDVLDLRGTLLDGVATDTLKVTDITAEWLPFFPVFDQWTISEITVDGRDDTPPVISVPPSLYSPVTGRDGATVFYDASAIDESDGEVPVDCVPASGSTFGIGSTTVDCSARDAAGNSATATFAVHVELTPAGVCSLLYEYITGSARYQALSPSRQAAVATLLSDACSYVDAIVEGATPRQKATLVRRFERAVDGLASQRWLTAEQAATLMSLAGRL